MSEHPESKEDLLRELALRYFGRLNPGATMPEEVITGTAESFSHNGEISYLADKLMEAWSRIDENKKLHSNRERDYMQRLERNREQIGRIWNTCLRYTQDNDGCGEGKVQFLKDIELPEELWPTVTIKVERIVEMPWLGDPHDIPDAEIANFIDESCDSGFISEMFDHYILRD